MLSLRVSCSWGGTPSHASRGSFSLARLNRVPTLNFTIDVWMFNFMRSDHDCDPIAHLCIVAPTDTHKFPDVVSLAWVGRLAKYSESQEQSLPALPAINDTSRRTSVLLNGCLPCLDHASRPSAPFFLRQLI